MLRSVVLSKARFRQYFFGATQKRSPKSRDPNITKHSFTKNIFDYCWEPYTVEHSNENVYIASSNNNNMDCKSHFSTEIVFLMNSDVKAASDCSNLLTTKFYKT